MAKGATSIEPGVLDELNRLRAARDPIAGWLAGLEAERESVSEPVYRRVREDYAKRIADLDGLARPLRVAATRAIAAFDEQLAQLETEKGAIEVDLQEIELRRFLDEYSAAEFEERARAPRERIAELGRELEEIAATRELWLAARGEAIPEAPESAAPGASAATPVDASTAAVSIAPASKAPAQAPSPAFTTVAPPLAPPLAPSPAPSASMPPAASMPGAAPTSTVPVGAEVRPLSPASITMPRPIPPPRPSSPAIPLPTTSDAAARTVHLSGPPPAAPPAPSAPPAPTPLDRTVVFVPEPPSPAPASAGDPGVSTLRLQATLVPVEPSDSGGGAAKGHVLAAANTIGRVSDNAIQIQHGSVSRHHAILRFTAEGWTLEDLKAENGTWVNGERIDKRQLLDGDRVNIGTVRFVFQLG